MTKRFEPAELRRRRLEAGLRGEEIAVRAAMSLRAVQSYEAGQRIPSIPRLARLSEALGCDMDELLVPAEPQP